MDYEDLKEFCVQSGWKGMKRFEKCSRRPDPVTVPGTNLEWDIGPTNDCPKCGTGFGSGDTGVRIGMSYDWRTRTYNTVIGFSHVRCFDFSTWTGNVHGSRSGYGPRSTDLAVAKQIAKGKHPIRFRYTLPDRYVGVGAEPAPTAALRLLQEYYPTMRGMQAYRA